MYQKMQFAEVEDVSPEKVRKHSVGKIIGRSFIIFGLLILFFIIFCFGCVTVVFRGPSETVRNLLTATLMETSAAKFVPRMYFSDEEINSIMNRNAAVAVDEITDVSLVSVKASDDTETSEKAIEVIDISASTFNGKLMIVHDPSKVKVAAASTAFGVESEGKKIDELISECGAVAGINAGGFADENGVGNGGQPLGLVIKDGKLLAGGDWASCVIGFDNDDKLVVGTMKASEALDRGLRDAVSFGPVYIVNGKRSEVIGTGGGLNPRTCIGQTADGSVLLLVIDGRQATSLGATHSDCIDILEEYGAVNAANLDGGSSSVMYYDGEVINVSASVYGPRKLPTAFVIMP